MFAFRLGLELVYSICIKMKNCKSENGIARSHIESRQQAAICWP